MKKDSFKHYDAFISYRHTPLDMFVAKTIQKKLEEFKLPKNVKRQQADWERKKIEKVFRDQDELPITSDLSDQIYQALTVSDYLIVICSPRIKESLWCQQEIQTFIEMRGYDHVLPVLIEGEPAESFPDEIVYRQEPYTDEYGNVSYELVPVEPLAADVRGSNKKEIKKKIEEEIMRLVAPMFSVDYDDLKQRHKEQRIKKRLRIAAALTGVFAAFGIVSGLMALQIEKKNAKIEAQQLALTDQYDKIQEQYESIGENMSQMYAEKAIDHLREGDRENALSYAYMAMTEDENGNSLPYTKEALDSICTVSYAYEPGLGVLPFDKIVFENEISFMVFSPNNKYMMVEDERGILYLVDPFSQGIIRKVDTQKKDVYSFENENKKNVFITDEIIIYYTQDYLAVYDFIQDEVLYSYSFSHNGLYSADYHMAIICSERNEALLRIYDTIYRYKVGDTGLEPILILTDYTGTDYPGTSSMSYSLNRSEVTGYVIINEDDTEKHLFFVKDLETLEDRYVWKIEEVQTCFQYELDEKHLYMLGRFANGEDLSVISKDVEMRCYDLETMDILWSREVTGFSSLDESWIVPDISGAKDSIGLLTGNLFKVYDATSGETYCSAVLDSAIISAYCNQSLDTATLISENGSLYSVAMYNDTYSKKQTFGTAQESVSVINDSYYMYQNGSNEIHIWKAQRGLRIEEKGSVPNTNEFVLNPEETRIYAKGLSNITCYDLVDQKEVWKADAEVDQVYYMSDGNILTISRKAVHIFAGESGEELYGSLNNQFFQDTFFDVDNNKLYYHDLHGCIKVLNTSDFSEQELYTYTGQEKGTEKTAYSSDGSFFVIEKADESGLMIVKADGTMKTLDMDTHDVEAILFFPDEYNFLVQFDDGSYDVYSAETGDCLYSCEESYNINETGTPGVFQWIERGNEDFRYIVHGSKAGTVFMNGKHEIIMKKSGKLRLIPGKERFSMVYIGTLYTVPFYTINDFIEDVEKIRLHEVTNEISE